MTIKIGINGFDRIGRMVFRAALQNFKDIEVVGINDLLEPDCLAYMLRYDSVHGRFKGGVAVDGNTLIVNGKRIRLTAVKDPAELAWSEVGADIVVESTGPFLTKETCHKHIVAGAKKVIQSAPSKDDTPMFPFLQECVMAFISLRQLLDHAAEHGYGVPAFNVNNLEQIHAIMQAAQEMQSPVILQASAGARKYAGEPYLRHMVLAAVESHADIPVVLHQDHGASASVCLQAIRSGFSSVMMDGSLMEDQKTPASYDYNVAVTRRVVEMSHAVGVSVEGELGCLGSLETGAAGEEDGVGAEGTLDHSQLLTDPDQAVDFVARTGVDALAIAIGTSHGAYKFSRQPTGDILAMDRIAAIHARLPNTHLVMHGSSSVPQEWLETIRKYGGDIKETYGVPVEEIQRGIKSGVRKINIDTDIRLAMTGAMRKVMFSKPDEFDPRAFLKAATAAARDVVKARFEAFGCAGQAPKIKVLPLAAMAQRYAQQDASLRQAA